MGLGIFWEGMRKLSRCCYFPYLDQGGDRIDLHISRLWKQRPIKWEQQSFFIQSLAIWHKSQPLSPEFCQRLKGRQRSRGASWWKREKASGDWRLLAWGSYSWAPWKPGIPCDWVKEQTWLSLVGPKLEAGTKKVEKLSVIYQVPALWDW